MRFRIRAFEGVGEAYAVYWQLLVAIDDLRMRNTQQFVNGGNNVHHVVELSAHGRIRLDAGWPRDHHGVAGTAEVRGEANVME